MIQNIQHVDNLYDEMLLMRDQLLNRIEILEDEMGVKAIKNFQPMQPGDVMSTAANTDLLETWINFTPSTSIEKGVRKFAKWYLNYYKD